MSVEQNLRGKKIIKLGKTYIFLSVVEQDGDDKADHCHLDPVLERGEVALDGHGHLDGLPDHQEPHQDGDGRLETVGQEDEGEA